MSLIDDVHITVKAGNGGNGGASKKQLFGSNKIVPDGGNGGRGGNIYFKGNNNIADLSEFQFKKEIKAPNGGKGMNKNLDGANGEDVTVLVPFGTTVIDESTGDYVEILTDLPFCVAYGGIGGIGTHDYTLNLKKVVAPRREGGIGDERKLHLILNLIADVGLVGLPNAGKSSLLKALTNAVPKIGAYPFTTTEPNLGALGKIIIADIPGLIEGASKGKGLGHQFLKHIKKTSVLVHCIDATSQNVTHDYDLVRKEFGEFDKSLLVKDEIILITKTDLVDENIIKEIRKELARNKRKILEVSIFVPESLEELKTYLQNVPK